MSRGWKPIPGLALLATVVAACGGGGGGGGNDTPSPTRTPSQQQSVCGGPITSVPKVCDLEVVDAGTRNGVRYVTERLCFSDKEGDLSLLCGAVSVNGTIIESDCDTLPDFGATVNQCIETDPIAVGTVGFVNFYAFALNITDRQDNLSNTVTTTFSCCR